MPRRRFVYLIEAQVDGYGPAYLSKSGEQLIWQRAASSAMQFDERDTAEEFASATIDGSYKVEPMPLAWLL